MTARYEVGELVNLEFRRLPVVSADGTHLVCQLPNTGGQLVMPLDHAGLTVTRVAPKEWPPRPGDIWETADGRQWFARHDIGAGVRLACEDANSPSEMADWVMDHFGRMRLVYRRGWSPTPEPATEPTAPAEVDKRAATIAGLREMADWLEANPSVYVDKDSAELSMFAWQSNGRYGMSDEEQAAEIRRVAEIIGSDPTEGKPGGPHSRVVKTFSGGVKYELIHVLSRTTTDVAPEGGEVADVEHYHVRGTAGLPGENEAECACGVTYAGFDSHAEAVAALEQHITAEDSPAGPAASVDDPPGDAVLGDCRPQDRPGQTAAPSPTSNGVGAAVPPDVWVARRRRGIHYHQADGRQGTDYTDCGRAARPNGNRIPLTEAEAFGAVPCPRCYGTEG
jgi:hypothetical protein